MKTLLLGIYRALSRTGKILLITLLVLIAIRIALPYGLKYYTNWVLQNKIEGYTGRIEDFDLSLWRGAYQIQGLKLSKVQNKVPVPFIAIREIEFSIAWKPLLRGHVVGKVHLDEASVNFVAGPTEAESQTGTEGKGWQAAVDSLFPLEIEEFTLSRSSVHFLNLHARPKIDVVLDALELQATNLGNTQGDEAKLVSDLNLRGRLQKSGELVVKSKVNLLRQPLAFDGNVSLTKLEISELNDFLTTYGRFNVKTGRLDVYAEAASLDGKLKGYVKPFMTRVDVIQVDEKFKSLANVGAEIGAGTVNLLVRRFSKDQMAAKVPFEGSLENPEVPLWKTIQSVLSHAYGRALKPQIDREIDIKDAK
ncbi:MAG TPA: DUF748 domain-containing protein [Bdellovibrionota bacterium]|jgi:hypothetical protein|nr:DUF748 domain-containing protein [Bdellovibrionota bacterium]